MSFIISFRTAMRDESREGCIRDVLPVARSEECAVSPRFSVNVDM